MENSDEFFSFICACGKVYSPAQSAICPDCQHGRDYVKSLKFDVDGFLNKLYKLKEQEDDSLDIIFDAFYHLWDMYPVMNEILEKIDASKLKESVMIGFLTQTFKYSEKVPNHSIFFKKVANELLRRGETQDTIKDALQGLETAGNHWKRMEDYGATGMIWGPTLANQDKTENKHIGSTLESLFDELDEREELELLTQKKIIINKN